MSPKLLGSKALSRMNSKTFLRCGQNGSPICYLSFGKNYYHFVRITTKIGPLFVNTLNTTYLECTKLW